MSCVNNTSEEDEIILEIVIKSKQIAIKENIKSFSYLVKRMEEEYSKELVSKAMMYWLTSGEIK